MPGPIERVVIVVKENHGFDTYFGRFPGVDGDATLAQAASPPANDPSHTHKAWLDRATGATREQYVEADVSTYWDWARRYTLCDRYFTDVAGPSTPNHLMLIAGDSPWVDNPSGGYRAAVSHEVDLPSLPAQLEAAGLTWANYGGYAFEYVKALATKQLPSTQFVTDARAGKLPSVSYVYADHAHSEHPPDGPADKASDVGDVASGMAWTAAQVEAIVAGGLWDTTAIFVTWDDWGGWWDHVDPPQVETWSDGTQFRYGGRVPCLVMGGHAKTGYVSHTQHSHVSLVRFCEETFGLAPLNARVGAADGMSDCFDYSRKAAPPGSPPQTPQPQPQPQPQTTPTPPSPAQALAEIRGSAARAAARIATAAAAAKEPTVLQELRWAAEDVDRIRRLSAPPQ